MSKIVRTDAKNSDFLRLISELDAYLRITDGDDHEFYNQFNTLEKIKNLNLKINSLNILSNTRIKNLLAKNRISLEKVNENLQILNPLAILKRGYSIIHNKDGNVIKSNAQININEELTARFGKGNAVIKVKKIND